MAAVLILLASGNCVSNVEVNKSKEEIYADYSKSVTPVCTNRVRL
jgi:hypothetical protein